MIWELAILGIILLISIFLEKIYFDINPYLWVVGGIVALVFGALGIGVVSWPEAILCFMLSFVLILIARPYRVMGGGIQKGLMMCALFLGRYVLITYVLFFLLTVVRKYTGKHKKIVEIPGEAIIPGMPLVTVAVAITILVIYKCSCL